MLEQTGLLNEYLRTANSLRFISGTFAIWNKEQGLLKFNSKPFACILTGCLTVAVIKCLGFVQIILFKENANQVIGNPMFGSYLGKMLVAMAAYFCWGFISAFLFSWTNLEHIDHLQIFFNECIKFEHNYCRELQGKSLCVFCI